MVEPWRAHLSKHRGRVVWVAIFAVLCVLEWAVVKAKEAVGKRILDPPRSP